MKKIKAKNEQKNIEDNFKDTLFDLMVTLVSAMFVAITNLRCLLEGAGLKAAACCSADAAAKKGHTTESGQAAVGGSLRAERAGGRSRTSASMSSWPGRKTSTSPSPYPQRQKHSIKKWGENGKKKINVFMCVFVGD